MKENLTGLSGLGFKTIIGKEVEKTKTKKA
jgi:hypothetical protein